LNPPSPPTRVALELDVVVEALGEALLEGVEGIPFLALNINALAEEKASIPDISGSTVKSTGGIPVFTTITISCAMKNYSYSFKTQKSTIKVLDSNDKK
jgi:hypothetical protein